MHRPRPPTRDPFGTIQPAQVATLEVRVDQAQPQTHTVDRTPRWAVRRDTHEAGAGLVADGVVSR
jgi:hypothetical protein